MARKEKLNPKIVEDAKQFLNNLENCNKKAQENNEARLNKMKKKVLNLLQSRNEKTQEQKEAHLNKVKKFARQANDLKAKKKFGNTNKSDRLNSLQNAATCCRKPFPSGFVTLTCPVRKVQVCKSKQGLRFNRLSHWHMMFSNFEHFSLISASKS